MGSRRLRTSWTRGNKSLPLGYTAYMFLRLHAPGIAVGLALMSLVTAAAGTPGAQSSSVTPTVDIQALGPQVGQMLPDFGLPDQSGHERTFRSIVGPNGAVVVFFRSADWCPYCKTQLVELQGRLREDQKAGI